MLGTIKKDYQFKKVEGFLDESEIKLLTDYTRIKHRKNIDSFDHLQSDNSDTYFYGDPVMESLMLNKKELMQRETNLKLLPTYAFWRMYTMFADLKKHKDRPACEISVSVMINSDGTPWPFYAAGEALDLKPGDAVIYHGTDIEHWREEFKGDWHAQVFMHYVDANGLHTDQFKDGRQFWGTIK